MLYYENSNRKGKRAGTAAALLYVGVWAVLMFTLSFQSVKNETGEGILIDFGDNDDGFGTTDPDFGETADFESANDLGEVEYLTQDFEEAPEAPSSESTVVAVTPRETQSNSRSESAANNERQVNQRAIFPGRTEGSTSSSEGSTSGSGNQGSAEGSPGGSHDGSGAGAGGTGVDLAGRSVVGSLPQPVYGTNKAGRVIVDITVDAGGVVTNAAYQAVGSTTNDPELVSAALRAARQSRFNAIAGDELQTGRITYNFRLQ